MDTGSEYAHGKQNKYLVFIVLRARILQLQGLGAPAPAARDMYKAAPCARGSRGSRFHVCDFDRSARVRARVRTVGGNGGGKGRGRERAGDNAPPSARHRVSEAGREEQRLGGL